MSKLKAKANLGRKAVLLSSVLSSIMFMTACSTSSGVTSASNPAPVSFKGGQLGMAQSSYASARSSTMPYVAAPNSLTYAQPQAQAQPLYQPRYQQPAPQQAYIEPPRVATNTFDQSGVDTDLYMHQRVGKPYTISGKRYVPEHNPNYDETGIASWYGPNFHGKLTANGEVYDKDSLSAAHKTLPLNSDVYVTNLENGQSIKVRINDRGPFVDGRIIDLSEGAARALGVSGLSDVRVQYAGPTDPNSLKGIKKAELSAPSQPQQIAPAQPLAPQQPLASQVPSTPSYQPLSVVPDTLGYNETNSQPQSVAQAPVYQAPVYQAPVYQAPVYQAPAAPVYQQAPTYKVPPTVTPRPVDVTPEAPSQTRIAPLVPQITQQGRSRQEFTPPEDGGVMTLTISGPIHMASASDDINAQLIPTVYEGFDTVGHTSSLDVHYVQAATFSTIERANSVRSALSMAGPVSIHDVTSKSRTLHRVLVGPFKSKVEATQSLSQVTTLGYGDARIVEVY